MTRLEENSKTVRDEKMTTLNCMTENDESRKSGGLLVDAVQSRRMLCEDGMVQQRECRDDAVGGMVQCDEDNEKLFARTVKTNIVFSLKLRF